MSLISQSDLVSKSTDELRGLLALEFRLAASCFGSRRRKSLQRIAALQNELCLRLSGPS
ncbi:MAG: hypothetical protein AAF720_02535 [Pseudomonadota bacterium]